MALHIIAEACTNHDGNAVDACRLIKAAKNCEADSVKFQIINPEYLYIQKICVDGAMIDNPVIEQRRKSQLTTQDYQSLAACAKENGITFFGSAFDAKGLDLICELECPYIKIASCDINNLPLLTDAASRNKTIILSSGMAELHEVEKALACVARNGSCPVILMHCVSVYPAPVDKMNLSMISRLKQLFGTEVGLSDHTCGAVAAIAAVALGATWFEKHFTLDSSKGGFDHAHSSTPAQLAEYIAQVRMAEAACMVQNVKVSATEEEIKKRARRGVYFARDMAPGDTLTHEDLLIVRPESALSPDMIDDLLGQRLACRVSAYSEVRRNQLR